MEGDPASTGPPVAMNQPPLPRRRSADLAPLSPGRRVWLLTVLILLPFTIVCVPAALVYHFSGRQGTFASWGKSRGEPDVSGLRSSLERAAQQHLPPPDALDAAPLELRTTPDGLAARMDKLTRLAHDLGGSIAEGLPAGSDKHLYVELPAGRAAEFRAAARSGQWPSPLPAANAAAGNEHLEVIIHLGDE